MKGILSLRSIRKLYVNLVVAIVLVSMFGGALIQVKPVSAATGATWDPSLGWDFESHSNTHPYFTSLTVSQMKTELDAVNAAFKAHGYPPPKHFAYPYGDYNDAVEQVVSTYYKSARTVSDNMTTFPVPNWYELNAAQLVPTTIWSDVTGWISQCIAQKGLLIIFSHDVSANPSDYGCTPQMLARILDYLVQEQNAGKITVMTMAQAYDYWSAAKAGKPTVVMCFDDANESDYTAVYPLFKARGLKGTSYIVTSYVDQDQQLSWKELAIMRATSPTYYMQLQSKQNSSATTNLGTITFNSILYSLPSNTYISGGNYQAQYSPATGYTFDHWQTTGNVAVTSTTANPTTVNVTGNGTLASIYKASASVLFSDGFESGSFSAWTGTSVTTGETATVVNTLHQSGSYSAHFSTHGGSAVARAYCYENLPNQPQLYALAYVYFNNTISLNTYNNLWLIQFRDSGGSAIASFGMSQSSTSMRWATMYGGQTKAFASSGPTAHVWYAVEAFFTKTASGKALAIYVNGTQVASLSINTSGANSIAQARFGIAYCDAGYKYSVYLDTAIIDTKYITPP
jgi:peptidoglycan/xylan/chitin deacetylase (PgdA/CDA1 family)